MPPSYAYDPNALYGGKIENMTSKTEGGFTYNFSYNAAHIHAPTQLYYDKNGNSSGTPSEVHLFDVENRLSDVNKWDYVPISTKYLYDGSGEMVWRLSGPALDSSQIAKDVFIDGIYQERSMGCSGQMAVGNSYTKYYMALGRVIASRAGTITTAGQLPPGAVTFYAADHLGSTVATMNGSNGALLSRQQYYPFGAGRTGTAPERGYTGQQKEGADTSALGLYYYHARFYSPLLGHFVSADTITKDGLNRYGYATNNPIRYSDPTGHAPSEPPSGEIPQDHRQLYLIYLSELYGANLADVLFWAVGGEFEPYINLVAGLFGIEANVLAAVILNEMDARNFFDSDLFDSLAWALADGSRSVGIAQLSADAVMKNLRHYGLAPTSVRGTIDRLTRPIWAIIYAAGWLAVLQTQIAGRAAESGWTGDKRTALLIAYRGTDEVKGAVFRIIETNGCLLCDPGGPVVGQWLDVIDRFHEGNVHTLAVQITEYQSAAFKVNEARCVYGLGQFC